MIDVASQSTRRWTASSVARSIGRGAVAGTVNGEEVRMAPIHRAPATTATQIKRRDCNSQETIVSRRLSYDSCVTRAKLSLDEVDVQIIEILRFRGRATLVEIGERVGLSAPAVKRRIDALQEAGVIVGFAAQIDDAKLGRPLQAFTELRFAGDTKVAEIAGVARGLSEVQAVFTLAGDPDAVVWLRVSDTRHLTQTIDRLRRSGKVTGTKTLMVLDTWTPGRPQ
jgi:DNA-binding Lrp family transcriptional regulator